jgi:hypothetical protein
MKTFLMLLIVALYLGFMQPANAGIFAYGDTTEGGRINLTDVTGKCENGSLVMFEAASDGRVAWGCWMLIDDYISILYTNGTQRMFKATSFKEQKHGTNPGSQSKSGSYKPT